MSDSYPEYLNPFAEDLKSKPKTTLKHSFKELKRTLRQSFRIKKKEEDDVTYRQKPVYVRRLPVSYAGPQTEALPRSRFHERVSKLEHRTSPAANPFEEEETKTTTRRKGKKRAPLPPKSISSQHLNDETLEVSAGGSHWSLTSVETDYSGSADNTSRGEHENDVKRTSMVDTFVSFNKNMEQLKDDTNNNVVTKEELVKESSNEIPDLVVSCPSETKEGKQHTREESSDSEQDNTSKESTDLVIKDITKNMITDDNTNVKNEIEVSEKNSENQDYLYHEKTSLYIAGSRDELNELDSYTGRVSLYITGSCDDLDSNNESCNKHEPDENGNDDSVPIPKQRKNKLTKNTLLGM